MLPRLSLVTLGVADLERSRRFYERLGWRRAVRDAEGVAFFQLGPVGLALYPAAALAADAGLSGTGEGFRGVALAQNLPDRRAVDEALAAAAAAGGRVTKAGEETGWGGYVGYVADPDGHLWEIAWNPHFPLGPDGAVTLPE